MAVPKKYSEVYLPVRLFLSSSRALADGKRAIQMLEKELTKEHFLVSDWKINWVAACALLRTAVQLFQIDKKICVPLLADAISDEWGSIQSRKEENAIFWHFLRDERNNILKEYKWSAYETFFNLAGERVFPRPAVLGLCYDQYDVQLLIRGGRYDGRKAIEVIQESADWVAQRIESAIARAGLDPQEERSIVTFSRRPTMPPTLLGP